MSARGASPEGSQQSKRENRSAILLACAGGLVIAGACSATFLWAETASKDPNVRAWGSSIYALLAIMLVAIVLSSVALAFPVRDENSADSVRRGSSQLWLIFAALVLIHCTLAFLLGRAMPGGTIDTFTFQRDASKTLLQGVDPYGGTQTNIFDAPHTALFFGPGMVTNGRVQVGFQYPPLTLLWALPGYLVGDVRYSYILAVIISAMFLFAICPDARGLWVVAVLLLSPLTWWVENRCWTEPLVLMALSATLYAALKKRWWLPIALGLFLATKQYNLLALPFIGFLIRPFQWKAYSKLAGIAVVVAVATLLPFAIWNFRGLWHDLVLFHLAQPFRQDAVSFAVPFPFMLNVGPLLLIAFVAWATRARRRSVAMFAAAYGVALLVFVTTSKQAFANYYFLIAQTFFLSVAALLAMRESPGQSQDWA